MSRAQLTSTVEQNSAGAAAPFSAGKNKIINGDFNINQRNFTSNTTNGTYNFDRWVQTNGGTTGTLTVTPQVFTAGAAPVAGYESSNFVQCITAAGASVDTYAVYEQFIEDVRTLAGQTATISFWAKAASGTPKIALEINQSFGTGGSPSSNVLTAISAVTISTSWTRYTITFTVPSLTGKTIGTTANTSCLGIFLWLSSGTNYASRASSIGLQNNTFQIWGVQLESGSVATAFTTATGTVQGELAACQRYYQSTGAVVAWQGNTTSGSNYAVFVQLPVQMRAIPSLTITNYGVSGFGTSPSGGTATVGAFLGTNAATSTASAAYYQFTYKTDAEF